MGAVKSAWSWTGFLCWICTERIISYTSFHNGRLGSSWCMNRWARLWSVRSVRRVYIHIILYMYSTYLVQYLVEYMVVYEVVLQYCLHNYCCSTASTWWHVLVLCLCRRVPFPTPSATFLCRAFSVQMKRSGDCNSFAPTSHALRLMETLAASARACEPVLLVRWLFLLN